MITTLTKRILKHVYLRLKVHITIPNLRINAGITVSTLLNTDH
jgi:hypothetical protein